MAVRDLRLRAMIDAILKDKGFKDLDVSIEKSKKAMKGASTEAKGFGTEMVSLAKKAALVAVATKGLFLMRDAVVSFAAKDRIIASVSSKLNDLGLNATGAVPRVRALIDRMGELAGVSDRQTARALNRFLDVTQDLDTSIMLVETSLGVAVGTMGSFDGAAVALTNLLEGRTIKAATALGVSVTDASGKMRSQDDILRDVINKYSDLSSIQGDVQTELNSLGAAWDAAKDGLGEVVAVIGMALGGFKNLVKIIKSAGPAIYLFGTSIGSMFKSISGSLREMLDFRKLFTDPKNYLADIKDTWRSGFDEFAAEAEKRLEDLKDIWSDSGEASGKAHADALQKALDVAARNRRAREKAEADKRAEMRRRLAVQLTRAEIETEMSFLQPWHEKRHQLEVQLLELQSEEAKRAAKDDSEAILRIDRLFWRKREKLWEDYVEAIHKHRDEIRKAELENQERIAQGWEDIFRDVGRRQDDENEIWMRREQTKLEQQQVLTDAAFMLGRQLFEESKSVQIAIATAETFVAANRALATPPVPNYVLMAAAIAAGLANVAQIAGIGFDDPENDRLARIGGRKWARDLLDNLQMGFRDEMSRLAFKPVSSPAQPTVINRTSNFSPTTSTTVNISGFVGAGRTETMKRFQRDLDRANRQVVRASRFNQGIRQTVSKGS